MAIKAKITEVDYAALPPALKEHYTKQDDGSYRLDASDAEDVYAQPLKRALEKEREEQKALSQTIAKLKADVEKYKDIDPEKARAALKRLEDLDDKTLLDEGKVEELLQKRTEKLRLDYENREKQAQAQLAEKEKAITESTQRLERVMVDQGITLAASKAGVRAGALGDVIRRAREVWRLDGEKALPFKDGAVQYGKNATEPMSMDEWVMSLATSDDGKHLFEGNKGGGALPGQRQVNGRNVISLSREEARNPARYREAQDQAAKAGMELIIAEA